MNKEIDIFGWKYELSESEMNVVQAIMVITVMLLIMLKGITNPLAYKLYCFSGIGMLFYFLKSIFS